MSNKFTSYFLAEKYLTAIPGSQVHKDATNISEFDTIEELQASADYIEYIEKNLAEKNAVDYANLDKLVLSVQIEKGCNHTKESLLMNAISKHGYDSLPVKTKETYDWWKNLWMTKYHGVSEGDFVSFDDVQECPHSFLALQIELGF